jgi:hypothetical protein
VELIRKEKRFAEKKASAFPVVGDSPIISIRENAIIICTPVFRTPTLENLINCLIVPLESITSAWI